MQTGLRQSNSTTRTHGHYLRPNHTRPDPRSLHMSRLSGQVYDQTNRRTCRRPLRSVGVVLGLCSGISERHDQTRPVTQSSRTSLVEFGHSSTVCVTYYSTQDVLSERQCYSGGGQHRSTEMTGGIVAFAGKKQGWTLRLYTRTSPAWTDTSLRRFKDLACDVTAHTCSRH